MRPSASRNCSRPSSMCRRLSCGVVPPLLSLRKFQLPGSPLRGAVSSSTSGRVRRTSGNCTLPRSSGHTRTSISTRSALTMVGCFAQGALAKVRVSARTVLVRPRSTSRLPMCRARPVRACTARSTGPLNQFQSQRAMRTSSAASRNTSTASQRCPRRPGRPGRRRRQRDALESAGAEAAFTPPWLPRRGGRGAKRSCASCAEPVPARRPGAWRYPQYGITAPVGSRRRSGRRCHRSRTDARSRANRGWIRGGRSTCPAYRTGRRRTAKPGCHHRSRPTSA